MTFPIKIDLRDLTQEHLDEAFKNLGQCDYAAPCIIGVLMDESDRFRINEALSGQYQDGLTYLVLDGLVSIPPDQLIDAQYMQDQFDRRNWYAVTSAAYRYMKRPPVEETA